MAGLRRGKEAARAAATRSGSGKFTPTHRFTPNEVKFLQFLTPFDEIPTALFHRFITVGYREDGSKIYRDFISPLDEAIDGPTGDDPLVTRFGSNPSSRCIGIALELTPQYEQKGSRKAIVGWDVVEREYTDGDGNEKKVPNVALVIESPFTFYNHLGVVDDQQAIEECIVSVTRTGKSTDTSYTILPVGEALSDEELDAAGIDSFFEEFDFDSYLDELMDKDRLHEYIDPLPDDFVVNPYAKKGKGGKDTKTEARRGRRSRQAEPEAEVDAEPEGAAEAVEAAGEEGSSRRRRFSQLRTEVTGS